MRYFISIASVGLLMTGCPQHDEGDPPDSAGADSGTDVGNPDEGNTGADEVPAAPNLELGFSQVKQFDFSWGPTYAADYYQLLERIEGDYVQVGGDILAESISLTMPLHLRADASHQLRACNATGCTDSEPVDVTPAMVDAIGYFKASNSDEGDLFGWSIALSADGNTLALSALGEDSNALGVDGDESSNSAIDAGAVYVFRRDADGGWQQQAYVKASNTNANDEFGWRLALSANGDTLAVGAIGEDSNAVGLGGNPVDNSADDAGAVYVFEYDVEQGWMQQAYVKPSNTGAGDEFGWSVALSGDGATLAVGAHHEASAATGIDGNQADDLALGAGAVYMFTRDAVGTWTQQAYVKPSNTGPNDNFGTSVALSTDGKTLAVGAAWEDSSAAGIDGDQADDLTTQAGAVYVFTRDELDVWAQQAYVKASNPGAEDLFGERLALSASGDSLAVGSRGEDSDAIGIDGDQTDDSATDAGAVYVFTRDELDAWTQQAYVKPSNTGVGDRFGADVAFSADGRSLAVGAVREDSNATGIGGDASDGSLLDAGAAYLFEWDPAIGWRERAYVKASNTGAEDFFGDNVALSGDATTLVISSYLEDASASGIGGDQTDDSGLDVGAVYVY